MNFYFILGFEVLLAVAELELKAPALLVGSLFGISTSGSRRWTYENIYKSEN